MLAEDFGALGLFFLVLCAFPFAGAVIGIAFVRLWPKISLTCGILSSLFGLFILITLAQADAPPSVWAIASVPLLCGLGCLARWFSIRNGD